MLDILFAAVNQLYRPAGKLHRGLGRPLDEVHFGPAPEAPAQQCPMHRNLASLKAGRAGRNLAT